MLLLAGMLMVLVGVSLGLLGGGGSILAMPVLVYVAGIPVRDAVALSLAIVGISSLGSSLMHAKAGRVDRRAVVRFGVSGMLAAPLGARLSERVAPPVLLVSFAALMLVVGMVMLRPRAEAQGAKPRRDLVLVAAGAVVGLLTGFLGVGGGFLIVPALVLFAGLSMTHAVGTSLAVITLNSLAAFLSHRQALHLDVTISMMMTGAALAGAWLGARWSQRWSPPTLRRAFAVLVIGVALTMGAHNVAVLTR